MPNNRGLMAEQDRHLGENTWHSVETHRYEAAVPRYDGALNFRTEGKVPRITVAVPRYDGAVPRYGSSTAV